jgi:ketosteroid isomerase-like protein
MERWQGRGEILEDARAFAAGGGRLVRLEFPRVEVQAFGDVVVVYSQYVFETDTKGKRETSSGRATEVFVRRGGRWVNPGWHMDSGR